jgi:hypothetical protein
MRPTILYICIGYDIYPSIQVPCDDDPDAGLCKAEMFNWSAHIENVECDECFGRSVHP